MTRAVTPTTLRSVIKWMKMIIESVASFLKEAEVKVVWREEDKTKVGRGKIINDDLNFVYLSGEKGTVIVNKRDIIAIKQ